MRFLRAVSFGHAATDGDCPNHSAHNHKIRSGRMLEFQGGPRPPVFFVRSLAAVAAYSTARGTATASLVAFFSSHALGIIAASLFSRHPIGVPMKRIAVLACASLFALGLAACGGKEQSEPA